jgi:ribonuclease HI
MTKGKMSGRVCIACTSKKNNARLKEKGYYKQYYQQHAEQLKQADKVRYQRVKAEKNLVKFTFPDYVVVGEAKNDDIEV